MGERDSEANLDTREPECDCLTYAALFLIFGSVVCLPPVMLYSGVTYGYCEIRTNLTDWLVAGGILYYIVLVVFALNWKKNKTMDPRRLNNCCIYFLFLVVFVALFLWWLIGMIPRLLQDHWWYGDLLLKDADCRFWVFKLTFWFCFLPSLLIFGLICFGILVEDPL